MLQFVVFQHGDGVLGRVVQDVLDLKLVLVIGVTLAEVAKFLSLVEAPFQVFRRYKVLGHLDAVVHISDLKRSGDYLK